MTSERLLQSVMLGLLALLLLAPGCLLVGRTEHRVEVLSDGSALVTVRYIDLRSDGETDSAVVQDLDILLDSFASASAGEHLPQAVLVMEKHLGLQGDALVAEIHLRSPDLATVEGFHLQGGRPTVIIPEGQWITWTNGAVSRWSEGSMRIQWSDTSSHLEFDIQPIQSTEARSLAPLYRERVAPQG